MFSLPFPVHGKPNQDLSDKKNQTMAISGINMLFCSSLEEAEVQTVPCLIQVFYPAKL